MTQACNERKILADRRLIEAAFPLKQVSLDSVHEKNVRHGHISTLHIWLARRPLAASRAALLAALLPDPGRRDERRKLLAQMAGRVMEVPSAGGERMKEETRGGIFHWRREDGEELARFRAVVREAFKGRAPRGLDPFAGGGVIPLEAMRLGCEAVAADINPMPMAWFILRCTAPLSAPAGRARRARAGTLSNVCGVRAGAAQGARAVRFVHSAADGALPAPAAKAARNGRGRSGVGGFAQRGIRFPPSGERGESAPGGEAGG